MLAILSFSPAQAADPYTPLTVESLPEWWAAPGSPGFVDDIALGNGLPLTYLGLVAGGVSRRDGILPVGDPWPGVDEIQAPLAWYDSAAVVVGEQAAWNGFSGAIVNLHAFAEPPRGVRPRAAFTLVSGSSGVNRNGLLLQRGGRDGWFRGGAVTQQRAGTGLLGLRGDHLWLVELGRRRGAHTFSGSFSQRGAANTTRREARFVDLDPGPLRVTPPYVGFEEAARGENGQLSWSLQNGERSLALTLRRSHDHRESFESPFTDVIGLYSERFAQQNTIELEAAGGAPGHAHGLRLALAQAQVVRSADFLSQLDEHTAEQRSAWLAARMERPWWGGTLEAQAGAGYARAADLSRERLQAAPSIVWRMGRGARRLRVYGERIVTPVWSDLAPGVRPFTQDVWLAGLDVALGDRAHRWLELGGLGAEIAGRALITRWPVRDLSLRYGWSSDPERVDDAMVTLASGLRHGEYAVDASGFARVRPRAAQSAQLDPAVGARAGAEAGIHVFAGDLGVKLRLEAAWVGERENASLPEYFVRPRPLAGHATFGGSLGLTLGDGRLLLSGTNLEDQPHEQLWTDLSSPFPGTPAVGSGRQYRFELAWPLFN